MASDGLTARDLAGRLIAAAAAQTDGTDGDSLAVQTACERTCRELTRRLGQTGSDALLVRALAQARTEHPVLKEIRTGRPADACLEGVAAAVVTHDAPVVIAGLESVLEKLLGLLGRLIGDDMVARLVEQSATNVTQEGEDVT